VDIANETHQSSQLLEMFFHNPPNRLLLFFPHFEQPCFFFIRFLYSSPQTSKSSQTFFQFNFAIALVPFWFAKIQKNDTVFLN
jgi:hypothetical protein